MIKNDNRIERLIENYKIHLKNDRLKDELFKWQLLAKFKGRPHLNAHNFEKEITSIYFANLIYHTGVGVIYHLAKANPEAYKSCFELLFNENIPLTSRIQYFVTENLILSY
jgi:5-methylcytosine-specific restriction enzyme B